MGTAEPAPPKSITKDAIESMYKRAVQAEEAPKNLLEWLIEAGIIGINENVVSLTIKVGRDQPMTVTVERIVDNFNPGGGEPYKVEFVERVSGETLESGAQGDLAIQA